MLKTCFPPDCREPAGGDLHGWKGAGVVAAEGNNGAPGAIAAADYQLHGPRAVSTSPPLMRVHSALSDLCLDGSEPEPNFIGLPTKYRKSTSTPSLGSKTKANKEKLNDGGFSGFRKQLTKQVSKVSMTSSGNKSNTSLHTLSYDTLLFHGEERKIQISHSSVQVEPDIVNLLHSGRPNVIHTTKYTWITWLPKSLYEQFHRIANIYFLIIAVIVCALSAIHESPKDWRSKVWPYLLVLSWTALKDIFEDRRRKRDDDAENRQVALCYSFATGRFKEVEWQNVLVGDIIFVSTDCTFPADLVLLRSAAGQEAFISTITLDGETCLKERHALSLTDQLGMDAGVGINRTHSDLTQHLDGRNDAEEFVRVLTLSGLECLMAAPDCVVANIQGNVCPTGGEQQDRRALTVHNFLPRGGVLRNTKWIVGLSVYVGGETKTRLQATHGVMKFSNMQKHLNHCVRGLLIVLLLVCIYSASMAKAVGDDDSWILKFFKFTVALYHVVPMSLYIVYELLKLFLGYQVSTDKRLVDPQTNEGAIARTADLMEEMGQIDFLFSDKTGTLTANEMVFARCHVGGKDPGEFRGLPGNADGREAIKKVLTAPAGQQEPFRSQACWFFTCLAVCHAVQVELTAAGHPVYSGMSPDEVALVEAAHEVGITFSSRTRKKGSSVNDVVLHGPGDESTTCIVQHVLDFTSDRKRMSVIVVYNEAYYCITKGADSVIASLMDEPFPPACVADLQKFSKQGLRTLAVASRKIDASFYTKWAARWRAARAVLDNSKEAQMDEVGCLMEKHMHFVGVTAVEDRLQEGVPEAIETLMGAGLRVWVLTGDKTETAVDIAHSCCLFRTGMTLAYACQADSIPSAFTKLQDADTELDGRTDTGLILDGPTIHYALQDRDCRALIYRLGVKSRSCVCSRLSPIQKLGLVCLVQLESPATITLAIGDGANDVPMITGAHLGIAVRGKEGCQAVQASNIAISKFRFLVPLLLCHGRRAYARVALFLLYYLYKNVTLIMADILWMHQYKFSGKIAFPEYLSIGFNVFFTSWHILFVLGFDQDMPDEIVLSKPEVYKVGPARKLFNRRLFVQWMLFSVWHGCVAWLIPAIWIGDDDYCEPCRDGRTGDDCCIPGTPAPFWIASSTAFTIVIIVVILRLILRSASPLRLSTWAPSLLTFMIYIVALFLLSHTRIGQDLQPNMENVPTEMLTHGKPLAAMFITPCVALAVDLLEKFV